MRKSVRRTVTNKCRWILNPILHKVKDQYHTVCPRTIKRVALLNKFFVKSSSSQLTLFSKTKRQKNDHTVQSSQHSKQTSRNRYNTYFYEQKTMNDKANSDKHPVAAGVPTVTATATVYNPVAD